MEYSAFRLPGEIRFGTGISSSVGDAVSELDASRVALVTDPGIIDAGIADRIEQHLEQVGIAYQTISGVSPNPRDTECVAAAEQMREFGADLVIGLGGGSPIDLGKVTAGLATNAGTPGDWLPPRQFEKPPLPIIAIPTTAGTGSEVTRSAVVNDTATKRKISLRDPRFPARIALLDPELTRSLPASLTAATGMDALTHAIEAYTGKLANPMTDALALHAMRLIAANLKIAVQDGSNTMAREAMLMASVIAGSAFGNSDVAAVHCIAESVGGRYDTPHGVANSIFLPFLFEYNAGASPERHTDVAIALGVARLGESLQSAIPAAVDYLHSLAETIGIPRLQEVPGIRPEDFPWIAAASVANLSNQSNPREMTESDYLVILERVWQT